MKERILVRRGKSNDMAGIRALIATYPDKLLQKHLPHARSFYLAVAGRRIVGCCALDVYSKRLAEIRSLAVDREFQGRGIATALVEACIVEARRRRVYEVLAITGAKSFFEKRGFDIFHGEKYAMLRVL